MDLREAARARIVDTRHVRNWAGNQVYRARRLREPESIDALQELVRSSTSLRVLGSRHAFNDITDTTGDHISLARLPRVIEIDREAGTVTVDGAVRYGDLCPVLEEAGLALHNLASLPHISVAGACLTATHGSGDRLGNLSTAVAGLELVRADGDLVMIERSTDPDGLAAAVVSLGSLGVVTRLTLDVEPTYRMRQVVFEDLPIAAFRAHLDEITSAADSVSGFTQWRGPVIEQIWTKQRVRDEDGEARLSAMSDLFGATAATVPLHPIRGVTPDACTAQLGIPGPWFDRLPHFRLDHTPSAGEELQSEFFVAREHALAAFDALDALRDRLEPLVLVSEIRTIASDELWLSPAYRRPSVAFHFTWRPDWPSVRKLLPAIEAALEPFEPRPHWAKLFTMAPEVVRSRYERLPSFAAMANRFDPQGTFRNDFTRRYVVSEEPRRERLP
jgi:xylitol oxidase